MSSTILGSAVVIIVGSVAVAKPSRHKEKKSNQNFQVFFETGGGFSFLY